MYGLWAPETFLMGVIGLRSRLPLIWALKVVLVAVAVVAVVVNVIIHHRVSSSFVAVSRVA